MSSWTSYPKIYSLGHPALVDLLEGEIVVQEKVDGSQFSFGVFDGMLRTRSRGREFEPTAADAIFSKAVEHVVAIQERLMDGWTYRCEVIQTPKHNALLYGRVPAGCLVLFDIATGEEDYLVAGLEAKAESMEIDVVPEIYRGPPMNYEQFKEMLDRESFLGKTKIEGVVVKNYRRFGRDKKPLMGKLVCEAFKETNKINWKEQNPNHGDVMLMLAEVVRNERRWEKAVERMRDLGKLEHDPRDIGQLIRDVAKDVEIELAEVIKERLWEWAKKDLLRASTRGLPEWYKERLAKAQFDALEEDGE